MQRRTIFWAKVCKAQAIPLIPFPEEADSNDIFRISIVCIFYINCKSNSITTNIGMFSWNESSIQGNIHWYKQWFTVVTRQTFIPSIFSWFRTTYGITRLQELMGAFSLNIPFHTMGTLMTQNRSIQSATILIGKHALVSLEYWLEPTLSMLIFKRLYLVVNIH